jgi:hypothetical protein
MAEKKPSFRLRNGYAVLAIPESGLFVKNGEIVTGHETALKFNELVVFARQEDAEKHAERQKVFWKQGDTNGHVWDFPVIPVMVKEKL